MVESYDTTIEIFQLMIHISSRSYRTFLMNSIQFDELISYLDLV